MLVESTMRYDLPSHIFFGEEPIPIEIPDSWDVSVARMRGADAPRLTDDQLRHELSRPVEALPIREGARGASSAVILFDDMTRGTPAYEVVPAVLDELHAAGVSDARIWFMAGVGLHRALTRYDYEKKLGTAIVDRYPVYSHNPFFNVVHVGDGCHRTPVEINADVMAADYKISIGSVVPHPFTGFGGAGKIILPGVSSAETIRRNHTLGPEAPRAGEHHGNIVREEIDDAARLAGLDFVVNGLVNERSQFCAVYCGEPTAAFERATKAGREHYRTRRVEDADVVVANNFFKASEPGLGLNPGAIASLREGGTLVLSANSPEGAAPHYLNGRWGFNELGGFTWKRDRPKPERCRSFIVFSKYPDLGALNWYARKEDVVWAREWADVVARLGTRPGRAVIYPDASIQIVE